MLCTALDPRFRHLLFQDVAQREEVKHVLIQEAAKGLTDDPEPSMEPAPKISKQEAILERLLGKEGNTQSQPAPGDISSEVAAFISEKPSRALVIVCFGGG